MKHREKIGYQVLVETNEWEFGLVSYTAAPFHELIVINYKMLRVHSFVETSDFAMIYRTLFNCIHKGFIESGMTYAPEPNFDFKDFQVLQNAQ